MRLAAPYSSSSTAIKLHDLLTVQRLVVVRESLTGEVDGRLHRLIDAESDAPIGRMRVVNALWHIIEAGALRRLNDLIGLHLERLRDLREQRIG